MSNIITPPKVPWVIYEGATFRQTVTLLGSGVSTAPLDLTGCHGTLTIRNQPGQDVLMVLTDTNGGLIFGGDAGTIQIYISSGATSLLRWRTAVFDLLMTEASGDVDVVLTGSFQVMGNIY